MTQEKFRWFLNQDPMATEKLADGIRKFTQDTLELHKFVKKEIKLAKKK
jgi:transaldolase